MPDGVSSQVGGRPDGGWSMRSKIKATARTKAESAWRVAARCAALAREAKEKEEREYYVKMRDAWIGLGNRCQFFDLPDARRAAAREKQSRWHGVGQQPTRSSGRSTIA